MERTIRQVIDVGGFAQRAPGMANRILLEPGETDLTFFKMAPLNLWAGRSAGAHGYLSVTQSIEAHYELIRQILQSYGVLMTRREVREGLERLLRTEPSETPDDVLLRDVPKRNLHVA